MPLSNEVVRAQADALNTLFNGAQATLILALVNAAVDEASGSDAGAISALQDAVADLDGRVTALE